jgi:sterol 3beta-glucosyltransferase
MPPPADWPANASVTGYWFLDEGREWEPPEDLARFMSEGPPPVCVTFGSEIDPHPSQLYGTVFEALRGAGMRAVLVTGWADRATLPASDHVFVLDSAPYDWLFPRVSCVVHHAGTGTAAEVLRAGTPSVCVPFHGEQRYWARHMHSIGVATRPIARAALAVDILADGLRVATSDEPMRERARSLGAAIREERGAERAVAAIASYLTSGGDTPWRRKHDHELAGLSTR